jgi:hypothetical protein
MNVNRQIVSTAKGIKAILDYASPSLIIKARTDYFPWRPDKAISAIDEFNRLLGDRARVWSLDTNTRIDLPFSVSDIFQVGPSESMRAYWSEEPLYSRDISVQEFFELTNFQRDKDAILRLQPAEIFLALRYLKFMGCMYNYMSIDDYYQALGDWFGILDSQHVEFAFPKYTFMTPGYEPIDIRNKRYVKTQDWLAMVKVRA